MLHAPGTSVPSSATYSVLTNDQIVKTGVSLDAGDAFPTTYADGGADMHVLWWEDEGNVKRGTGLPGSPVDVTGDYVARYRTTTAGHSHHFKHGSGNTFWRKHDNIVVHQWVLKR
jgi:hypothetical protein